MNDEDYREELHVYRAVKNTKHIKMVMFCVHDRHVQGGGIIMLTKKCGMVRLGCGLMHSFYQHSGQAQINLGELQCGRMKR